MADDIRVMAVVPAEEPLRASASALQQGLAASIARAPSSLPKAMEFDPDFGAIPLASVGATALGARMTAERAPEFVVRGTMTQRRFDAIMQDGVAVVDGARLYADPQISTFKAAGCLAGPIGATADVERKLDVTTLASKGLTGRNVAIAIMDTGINLAHLQSKGLAPTLDPRLTWSTGVGLPGTYAVGHGTMCAFDALICAPEATLLDFPILLSNRSGGSQMDGFLSDALHAYSVLQAALRPSGSAAAFKTLVVNNSWGMYHESWDFPAGHPGRYADNPGHPFNIIVGALARAGADILFGAGNCGADCPDGRCQGVTRATIMGANAHPNVVTIAGATIQDHRVGYSSQGPGLAGMAHAKPDLTSYTHFLGSEAFGAGSEDSGTSAACPVAAGAVAALRTKIPASQLSPKDLARELRADARQVGSRSSGWNRNYGYGIMRPALTAARLGL